jgi:hypothetical protein
MEYNPINQDFFSYYTILSAYYSILVFSSERTPVIKEKDVPQKNDMRDIF